MWCYSTSFLFFSLLVWYLCPQDHVCPMVVGVAAWVTRVVGAPNCVQVGWVLGHHYCCKGVWQVVGEVGFMSLLYCYLVSYGFWHCCVLARRLDMHPCCYQALGCLRYCCAFYLHWAIVWGPHTNSSATTIFSVAAGLAMVAGEPGLWTLSCLSPCSASTLMCQYAHHQIYQCLDLSGSPGYRAEETWLGYK